MTESIMQNEERCYVTGSRTQLDCHHPRISRSTKKTSRNLWMLGLAPARYSHGASQQRYRA